MLHVMVQCLFIVVLRSWGSIPNKPHNPKHQPPYPLQTRSRVEDVGCRPFPELEAIKYIASVYSSLIKGPSIIGFRDLGLRV